MPAVLLCSFCRYRECKVPKFSHLVNNTLVVQNCSGDVSVIVDSLVRKYSRSQQPIAIPFKSQAGRHIVVSCLSSQLGSVLEHQYLIPENSAEPIRARISREHQQQQYQQEHQQRDSNSKKLEYNVVMLLVDALSRKHFLRSCPTVQSTLDQLREQGEIAFYDFDTYHALGPNSVFSLVPMLTGFDTDSTGDGRHHTQLFNRTEQLPSLSLDDFIPIHYRNRGYATAFLLQQTDPVIPSRKDPLWQLGLHSVWLLFLFVFSITLMTVRVC